MTDTPTEREAESIWTRLRRRKVVQWGVAYAAGAWLLMQVLEYFGGTFHWPEQIQQLTTLALLIGLPIVLVVAYYHGDRGHQRITTPEFAILTLLMLLGGGAFWYYQRSNESLTAASTAAQPAASAAPLEAAAAPDAKSIAVLPFVDMSPQKDQEYMSDGIAEELLNLLAKVPDLKVIARTSSFAFKGEKVEIADIAKKLNVAHVLEGSVRKSGNTLRITAQLIQAADSTHLWSDTYDRPLNDIFAVQDEIASAIAQALQIELMGDTVRREQGPTQNKEAYELYLRARNGEDWNTRESVDAADRYLRQAIQVDPEYSMAWSALATLNIFKAELGFLDPKIAFERARKLTERALQLDPESAHAHSRLQYIYLAHDWNWAASAVEAHRALSIEPTNPDILNNAARLSIALGEWEEAEQHLRVAFGRDPLNEAVIYNLGLTYYLSRRFDEAERTLRPLLQISPRYPWTRGLLGEALLLQGKIDEAVTVVQGDSDKSRLVVLPIVLWGAGRRDEADTALRAQIAQWGDTSASYVALSYAYRGDGALALEWLERAYKQKDPALIEVLGDPLFGRVLDDPGYKAFLRKMKLPERPRQSNASTAAT